MRMGLPDGLQPVVFAETPALAARKFRQFDHVSDVGGLAAALAIVCGIGGSIGSCRLAAWVRRGVVPWVTPIDRPMLLQRDTLNNFTTPGGATLLSEPR
jgi:hypothetical protein